jgi:hypothetical protein
MSDYDQPLGQPKFRLFIKAETVEQAITAAKAHKVLLEDPIQVNHFSVSGRARIAVHEADILRWFSEHNEVMPGYGYPIGTLLFYSNH